MGNQNSSGQRRSQHVRYHNGVRVIEEDHHATNIQRERFREQRKRLRKIQEHGAQEETPQIIRLHYRTREIYEDFCDAVAEVVRRHAPEQERDVPVMVRNHRGIEKRLYKSFEQLYGMEPNWVQVSGYLPTRVGTGLRIGNWKLVSILSALSWLVGSAASLILFCCDKHRSVANG